MERIDRPLPRQLDIASSNRDKIHSRRTQVFPTGSAPDEGRSWRSGQSLQALRPGGTSRARITLRPLGSRCTSISFGTWRTGSATVAVILFLRNEALHDILPCPRAELWVGTIEIHPRQGQVSWPAALPIRFSLRGDAVLGVCRQS